MSFDSSPHDLSGMAERFRGFLPVVIDVETAGFNAESDALLEIAACVIEMDDDGTVRPGELHTFNVLPFEGANLDPEALAFTGINPYDPKREPMHESTVLEELFKPIRQAVKRTRCNRAILVGHNASFDLGFLNAAVEREQIKRNPFHPFSTFDTATLSGLAFGHTVLAVCCKRAGIEFSNSAAHSADYDTLKTAELFCTIINKWRDLGGWPLEEEEPGDLSSYID